MHSPHPIHRALVTYTDSTTGEIRVKIPSLLGASSEVSISYIGRKSPWFVPDIGSQIVVMADDDNLTNIFWVQTDTVQGPSGDWATAQTVVTKSGSVNPIPSTDAGKMYLCSTTLAASTFTVTSATNFAVGQSIDLLRTGTLDVSVAATLPATIVGTPGTTLRSRYSAATIYCTAPNTYVVIGDLR